MICYVDLIKYLYYFSIFIDKKGLSHSAHVLFTVHALFDPDAVCLDDLFLGVGYQSIGEIEFRDKFQVRLFVVDRNAQYLDVLFAVFVVRITERTCFFRSARCVVFRVEPKHDTLALEILKIYEVAILIVCREVRSLVTFF